MREKLKRIFLTKGARISLVLLLFGLFLFHNIQQSKNFHSKLGMSGVMWSDAYNYYEYLPGLFIRKKIYQLKSGIRVVPGVTVNKVSYGVALMEAPFFLANFQIQKWRGYSGTGFESSYGYSILIAAITYAFAGCCMLFLLLKKWFGSLVAIISVIGVCYGTNMPHYIYAEPGMSHVYSFFCAAGLLLFTDRFYHNPRFGMPLILIAVFISIAVMVRPVNIVLILVFPFWNCYSWKDIVRRFQFIFTTWWLLPTCFAIGFLFLFPQMYYWHLTTGKWLVFSYGLNNESFIYLTSPKIIEALFSHLGGWIPFSQFMIFTLVMMPVMAFKKKYNGGLILVVFAIILYICSSWWATNFMCAHGYRSFIDYYPLFIIPFSYLLWSIYERCKALFKWAFTIVSIVLMYFAYCMNITYTPWERCNEEGWTYDDYIKLYDDYF